MLVSVNVGGVHGGTEARAEAVTGFRRGARAIPASLAPSLATHPRLREEILFKSNEKRSKGARHLLGYVAYALTYPSHGRSYHTLNRDMARPGTLRLRVRSKATEERGAR